MYVFSNQINIPINPLQEAWKYRGTQNFYLRSVAFVYMQGVSKKILLTNMVIQKDDIIVSELFNNDISTGIRNNHKSIQIPR